MATGRTAGPRAQGESALYGLQQAGGGGGGFGATSGGVGGGGASAFGGGPPTPAAPTYSGVMQGGAGSSYSGQNWTGPGGTPEKYTITPNLLPQQAKIAQEQTMLEGDIAAKAAGKGNEYTQSQASQREGLGEKAFQSQFDLLSPYFDKWMSGSSSGGGGGPMQPHVEMDPGGAEAAGQSAAFARAKDQAGSIGRSALNSLNDVMGARGITGSGIGVNQAGGVVQEGARQLGDVNREQLIQSLAMARQRASEQYQGNITQRGQDVTQQGNNVNKNLTIQQSLLGILGRGITY